MLRKYTPFPNTHHTGLSYISYLTNCHKRSNNTLCEYKNTHFHSFLLIYNYCYLIFLEQGKFQYLCVHIENQTWGESTMTFDRGYYITNESHDAPSNARQVIPFTKDSYHKERANPSHCR